MAWQQLRYLLDGEVQSSDDATKTLKLPLSNAVHSLFVKCECTNGGTSAQAQDLSDVVDKIEIIANGSEVVYSLTPKEIERWALLELGHPIIQERDESASAVQMAVYPIFFGDDEYDPNHWLPCSKFTDLELKISYSPTIAATSFATGTTTFTVMALMSMGGDPGPYQGTYKLSTIYSFTSAASGDEVIDLPRSHPYKKLLVYAYEAAIEDGVDITGVKFSLNNDERIPFNLDWDDLQQWNQQLYGLNFEEFWHLFREDTDTVATFIGNVIGYSLQSHEVLNFAGDIAILDRITTIAGDTLTLSCGTATIVAGAEVLATYATDHDMYLSVKGVGMPFGVVIPFDLTGQGALFDPKSLDQVQLTLTQGAAGAAVKVSLQELLHY